MHECGKSCINSIEIGRAALRIALTSSRVEETKVKERLAEHGIRSTAVDFGGEFIPSIVKIVERAVVAAQRQGLVTESHVGAGAVAGAAHHTPTLQSATQGARRAFSPKGGPLARTG